MIVSTGSTRLVVQVRAVPSHALLCASTDADRHFAPLCQQGQSTKFEFGGQPCSLKGDVLFEFHHQTALGACQYLFSFYLHTSFIEVRCSTAGWADGRRETVSFYSKPTSIGFRNASSASPSSCVIDGLLVSA